jgi:hypothetical protein
VDSFYYHFFGTIKLMHTCLSVLNSRADGLAVFLACHVSDHRRVENALFLQHVCLMGMHQPTVEMVANLVAIPTKLLL